MKKFTLFLLSILCIITCAVGFTACGNKETLKFSEYQYQLKLGNGETISGYIVKAANTDISGDITIPATYNDKPVIAIAKEGFKDCSKITTITVPEGVVILLSDAFNGCPSTIINLPSTIKELVCSTTPSAKYGKEINYNGTYADWRKIIMPVWPSTTVHLTNGDIVNGQFKAN